MMRAALVLALCAGPALADPISERGYALGCGEGCTIVAAGTILTVSEEGTDPAVWKLLQGLEPLSAVSFQGELGEMGDISAPVTLSYLKVETDDPWQRQLRAIQGNWQPLGEETPFEVQISGLGWDEVTQGETTASDLIGAGAACADGTAPGGLVLSLRPLGGDTEEAACWQVLDVSATQMDLRDVTSDKGTVSYIRQD